MNYVSIRVSTLRPNCPVPFDVFVHFKEKYLHYRKASDSIEEELLKKLKAKGIKKLFVVDEQEKDYLAYLESALDLLEEKSASVEQKANMASDLMLNEAENVEKNLDTEEGFNKTKGHIQKVVNFLTEAGAVKSIMEAAGASQDLVQHSANVSTLALGLAGELGLTDKDELTSLGLASLLHDIGMSKLEIDPSLPPKSLSAEKRSQYWKHTQAGVDALSGKPFVTPRVLKLVMDHEELGECEGFPNKLRLSKQSLATQCLSLANDYDRLSMYRKLSGAELQEAFFKERAKFFESAHVEALKKILNQSG